jgi:hypothetical protein
MADAFDLQQAPVDLEDLREAHFHLPNGEIPIVAGLTIFPP